MITQNKNTDLKGYIFDIQGLSVHDGPGCRTLIFFNGCTLNCSWCSNPEGINKKPSLMYYQAKCIACGNCVRDCKYNAIKLTDNKIIISRVICASCNNPTCVTECFTDALKVNGYEISVSRLFDIIRRDSHYWGNEGGITLSGGEPLLQIDFAEEILSRCHNAYIHTAIETCANVPWESFVRVIPYVDWILFDIKHLNSEEHKKNTNSANSLILENAKRLSKEFKGKLMFRLPLIPGFNDSAENINAVISFLKTIGKDEINILPLHHLGREKYQMLDKEYLGSKFLVPTYDKMKEIEMMFKTSGINCYVGSETPF